MVGPAQIPGISQLFGELEADLGVEVLVGRGERERPLEQVPRGDHVAALAGAPQVLGGACGELRVVGLAELVLVADALLEMPAGDLVKLNELGHGSFEPFRERSVQSRSLRLGSDPYAASRISRCRKRNA